jgi:hypothetical protein
LRDQLNGAITRIERVTERMWNTEAVNKFGPPKFSTDE